MSRHVSLVVIMAASLAACGDNKPASSDASAIVPASNQVVGSVYGTTVDAKDAVWNTFAHTDYFSFNGPAAFVEMTDFEGACAMSAQHDAPTGSLILDIGVASTDAAGIASVPTSPGTFSVIAPANPPSAAHLPALSNVAQAYLGDGCVARGTDLAFDGLSGTVTITSVHADGSYDGTFDLYMDCAAFHLCPGPDQHLSGRFSSAACATLDVNATPTCL